MARSMPSNTYLPPWEKDNIAQVPFVDSTSCGLSKAERNALQSSWAARSNTTAHQKTSTSASTRYSEEHNTCMVKTPLTAPPPLMPYETPIYNPPAPKTEPHPATFVTASPTQPDSESWSDTTTSTHSSPQCKQAPSTLPGNITSRSVQGKPSSHDDVAHPSRESRRRLSRMQRWKSAVKDLFVHQTDEDPDFERIETRHWTDE